MSAIAGVNAPSSSPGISPEGMSIVGPGGAAISPCGISAPASTGGGFAVVFPLVIRHLLPG
jgi:hypothetical protein